MLLHVSVLHYLLDYIWLHGYTTYFMHSAFDRYLGCFHFLNIISNAAMKTCAQVLVQMYVFSSLRFHSPRNEIVGSCGNSRFNIFTICQTVFRCCCNILHFHQESMRIPIFPYPYQPLLLLNVFLIIVILVGVKWYILVVLIRIPLMTNDAEHIFMGL